MNRAVNYLSLAVSFSVGAVVSLLGAFRGLNVVELLAVSGITIASLFLLMRTIGGYYSHVITRKLAEIRAERASRHLLDP